MHDDVLLIMFHHQASLPCSFCTLFPHFMLVFFSIPVLWEHICILNVRLGGETDQQNVIMHKAYFKRHFELTFEKNAYLFDTFFVIILIVGFHILASVLGSILEQFQEKALEVPIYYYHYFIIIITIMVTVPTVMVTVMATPVEMIMVVENGNDNASVAVVVLLL